MCVRPPPPRSRSSTSLLCPCAALLTKRRSPLGRREKCKGTGSCLHYEDDVKWFTDMGFDGVKIDNCGDAKNVTECKHPKGQQRQGSLAS